MTEPDLTKLEAHPFAELFPLIEGAELADLCRSIEEDGLLQPIVLFEGKILDGRNRYRAIKRLARDADLVSGDTVRFFRGNDAEALRYVASTNLHRRHLTASQRAVLGAKMASLSQGQRPGAGQARDTDVATVDQAAQHMRVSASMVKLGRALREKAEPHIIDMVERGEVKLAAALAVSRLDREAQRQLVTAADVLAAAEGAKVLHRKLARTSPERLLRIVIDVGDEIAARADPGQMAAAITDASNTVRRLDAAVASVMRVRHCLVDPDQSSLV